MRFLLLFFLVQPSLQKNLLQLGDEVTAQCTDENNYCQYWSSIGECQKNPAYMLVKCKKSCKVCTGCVNGIEPYPSTLPNSNYYTRLCTSGSGIKVVTGPRATDAALEKTAYLIDRVLANVDSKIVQKMNENGFRHAVMAAYPKELTTDIPEHSFLTPADYWNERARGLGGTIDHPLGSNAEENALCHSNDRYLGEDITIHEFAHSLHLVGLSQVYPDFDAKLNKAYRSAKSSNIWGSHYGMTNKNEYWAEGVQSYFNANYADSQAPTDDRDQLKASDRNLYDLIDKYLGGNKWKWESCLDTIVDI